jgi:hypothetical protein
MFHWPKPVLEIQAAQALKVECGQSATTRDVALSHWVVLRFDITPFHAGRAMLRCRPALRRLSRAEALLEYLTEDSVFENRFHDCQGPG